MGVFSDEFTDSFTKQIVDLWINPEIERRRQANRLPEGFALYAAQVIMNLDASEEVRFNEEVKLKVDGDFVRPVAKGEMFSVNELENIRDIELTNDDSNAGHITLLAHKEGWFIKFDFRYNAARSKNHLEAAREFLDAASSSLEKGHLRAVVDNMFSATELMAKGLLLMHDQTVSSSKKHGTVHSRYNQWGNLGNTDARYPELLNKLSSLRGPSRYLQKDFQLSVEEANEMLQVAEDMFKDLSNSIPKR